MPKKLTNQEIAVAVGCRPPLLMLDQAELSVEATPPSACGVKMVSINELVFTGHFPGHPILPGVLQIAAMTQLSSLLAKSSSEGGGYFLKRLKRVKFRRPVLPGMELVVHSEQTAARPDGEIDYKVSCAVNGEIASGGTVTLAPSATSVTPAPPAAVTSNDAEIELADCVKLMECLPHRPPFLLLDGAYGLGRDPMTVSGFKNITAGDTLLSLSGCDLYPPYLIVESGAQLCCANMLSAPENAGKLGIFISIDEAEFLRPARTGERLDIQATCQTAGRVGCADILFNCSGEQVASSQLKFVIVPASEID